jgi:hypothetical protein
MSQLLLSHCTIQAMYNGTCPKYRLSKKKPAVCQLAPPTHMGATVNCMTSVGHAQPNATEAGKANAFSP